MNTCSTCGAVIDWAQTTSGARMPLDPAPVDFAASGLVAFNPATGRARVLAGDDIQRVEGWRAAGVTLHRSHFSTCPSAERHRVHPAQEALL